MLDVAALRSLDPIVVVTGSHPGIIQSMLDFDHLLGRQEPSVVAIIGTNRKSERYFFGGKDVLIPVYSSPAALPKTVKQSANLFANFNSGRRVLKTTLELLSELPQLVGGTVFAERVPERHALELYDATNKRNIWITGGASVGVIAPGHVKLSAIGGVDARQLVASNLLVPGRIAVVSTSGGMVNELIRIVSNSGAGVSFAAAIGGERYPIATPESLLLAAQNDKQTKAIAYFGELGGDDEYRIVDLIKAGKITKPIYAYIAGRVAELFDTPPQFGHAKAMASHQEETASAKADALRAVGAKVARSFGEFVELVNAHGLKPVESEQPDLSVLLSRKRKPFASSLSYDHEGDIKLLGTDLLDFVNQRSFAGIVGAMFLGRPLRSKHTEKLMDFSLRLLVDHGPYVSGAVNTMITARAGKDLVSSLASGLLTIGPRFGGAINEAANTWLKGVKHGKTASELVEEFAAQKQYISGIGHKKYRSDRPDPRVVQILGYSDKLKASKFTTFAKDVESQTLQKKANLILNVDGALAAVLLDVLHEKEKLSIEELERLVSQEFFNSVFVLSRSVGFIGHYFDQVRLDEGLFRLGEDDIVKVA